MATRIKPAEEGLYETDLCLWARRQAQLLRARRFEELDLENLIEEVDGLADALESLVRNRAITLMVHLLELQHSPAQDPRIGWRETIRTQRTRLLDDLKPSLSRHLADRLPQLYARARHDAEGSLRDHGEQTAANALPTACPYTLDQITGDWLP
ncbi:MAG: DUF29 domain-containing protein [Geminicoccaceae bacterium]